jgi:hypothetical protein
MKKLTDLEIAIKLEEIEREQENTLEEASENYAEQYKYIGGKISFKRGAKWEAKRRYSEEEVKQMLIDCCGEVSCEDGLLAGKTPVELYKWIDEQFKKK